MILTIELPLPPKGCSPNSRGHWAKKASAVKSYRSDSCTLAGIVRMQSNLLQPMERVTIGLEFFCGRSLDTFNSFYHPRDKDNALAAMKGAIDGLVDARILKRDSHGSVSYGVVTIHPEAKKHKRKLGVVVTIETVATYAVEVPEK